MEKTQKETSNSRPEDSEMIAGQPLPQANESKPSEKLLKEMKELAEYIESQGGLVIP